MRMTNHELHESTEQTFLLNPLNLCEPFPRNSARFTTYKAIL